MSKKLYTLYHKDSTSSILAHESCLETLKKRGWTLQEEKEKSKIKQKEVKE